MPACLPAACLAVCRGRRGSSCRIEERNAAVSAPELERVPFSMGCALSSECGGEELCPLPAASEGGQTANPQMRLTKVGTRGGCSVLGRDGDLFSVCQGEVEELVLLAKRIFLKSKREKPMPGCVKKPSLFQGWRSWYLG